MYIRPIFKLSKQEIFIFLRKHSFGQLISSINGKIEQSYLPFVIDEDNNCLYGHLAKQNGQLESLQKAQDLKVNFLGNDAYISASWYQSTQQVPTWNYQAVQISGKATLLDNQKTCKVIDQLSQFHEAQFEEPWQIGKLSPKKLDAMLNAIVGFKIDIKEISGQSKMSQNKDNQVKQTLITGLLAQKDSGSLEIAKIMKSDLQLGEQ